MSATLHVIYGPSGAGKTTYGREFARRERAVHFALDDWMARLFGPDMPEPLEYDWMVERVGRCESQIWATAAAVIAAGTPAVLDIGLMRRADRARIMDIARAVDLPLQFHFVDAPKEVRRARVLARSEVRGETFAIEVTPEMFDFIEGVFEAPDPAELKGAIISESA
jgi:predicted kinase